MKIAGKKPSLLISKGNSILLFGITLPYAVLYEIGRGTRCLLERLPSRLIIACSSVPVETCQSQSQLPHKNRSCPKFRYDKFPVEILSSL